MGEDRAVSALLTTSMVKSFAQAFSKACPFPKVKPLVVVRRRRNSFAYQKSGEEFQMSGGHLKSGNPIKGDLEKAIAF